MLSFIAIPEVLQPKKIRPVVGKMKAKNLKNKNLYTVICYEFEIRDVSFGLIEECMAEVRTRQCSYDSLGNDGNISISKKCDNIIIRTGADFTAVVLMQKLRTKPTLITLMMRI